MVDVSVRNVVEAVSRRSGRERRGPVPRANRVPNPRGQTATTPRLSNDEALGYVTDLVRQHARGCAEADKPVEQKYHATSLGILIDKFLALTNRPTPPVGSVPMDEAHRGAMQALGLRLAGAGRVETT